MAEILFRVKDRPGGNAAHTRAGHAISVCPDGWPWSPAEMSSDEHRIVHVPGVEPEAIAEWVASVPGPLQGQRLAVRARRLSEKAIQNLCALPVGGKHEHDSKRFAAQVIDETAVHSRAVG